jgi:membrane protease YdiL (CAAX protease family)
MIAQDEISKMLLIITLAIPIYLWVFAQTFIWLFPAFLILAGLAVQHYLLKRQIRDKFTTIENTKQILYYAIIGLAVLLVSSFFVQQIPSFARLALTGIDGTLFGILMGAGEETFFRGGLTNWALLYSRGIIFLAIIVSAGFFTIYHLAVYGDQPNALLFVFTAGVVLAYIDVIVNRLAPSLIAHMLNNVFASLPFSPTGALSFLAQTNILLLIAGLTTLLIIYMVTRKKK